MIPRAPISLGLLLTLACGPKTPEQTDETTAPVNETTASADTNDDDPTMPFVPTSTGGPVVTSAVSITITASVTDPEPTVGMTTAFDPTTTTGLESTTQPPGEGLCARAGGLAGVDQLVALFLEDVLVDDRINAYFLRSDLDHAALAGCVGDQLGELFGCPGVVYTCKSMRIAHEGLGISAQDFVDFSEAFSKAWFDHQDQNAPDLTPEDFDAVVTVLGAMLPDIVEDLDSDLTIYQRVGRKPAYRALVGDPGAPGSFVANVAADGAINGFFAAADFARLNTCLTRQLTSLDGPNIYGLELDPVAPDVDPGVALASPCRDMVSAHAGLVDPNDDLGVETSDFAALVTDLVQAMTDAGVSMTDQASIAGVLGPLCPTIVTVDPENCP